MAAGCARTASRSAGPTPGPRASTIALAARRPSSLRPASSTRRAARRTVQKSLSAETITPATSGRDSRKPSAIPRSSASQPAISLQRSSRSSSSMKRAALVMNRWASSGFGSSRTSRSTQLSCRTIGSVAPIDSRMASSVATVCGSSARSNAANSAKLRGFLAIDPRQLSRVRVEPGVLALGPSAHRPATAPSAGARRAVRATGRAARARS